jgi:phage shock protein A
MALINRISRLFTADLHAVLDRLEEPDALLKQAIREMEDELASGESRLRWLDHEHTQLSRQMQETSAALATVAQQLDVCFDANEDALARTLIKRRLETHRLAGRLDTRLSANTRARSQQSECVAQNRRDLDTLRQQADILLDESTAASRGAPRGIAGFDTSVTDADVEVELLSEKQRRSRT